MKTATYTIQGKTPLLMHSERLANPFDALTRELKALTGKRKKTEDDLLDIARVEWLGGLYSDDDGIFMPGYNVFSSLIGGGKLHKLGTAIRRSAIIAEDRLALEYGGTKGDHSKLFDDKRFVDMRSVKVGTSKVMRCRPIFRDWKITFSVHYDESGLQRSDLDRCLQAAGTMIGLGDYRPRYGRFEVAQAA